MNKRQFIGALQKKTNLTVEQCVIVNDILEDYLIFLPLNEPNIIQAFLKKLALNLETATEVYQISKEILEQALKESLKHPFKSKDT